MRTYKIEKITRQGGLVTYQVYQGETGSPYAYPIGEEYLTLFFAKRKAKKAYREYAASVMERINSRVVNREILTEGIGGA